MAGAFLPVDGNALPAISTSTKELMLKKNLVSSGKVKVSNISVAAGKADNV